MRMRQLSNYFLIIFFFAIASMIVGCGGGGGKNDSVNIPPIYSPSGDDGGNENNNPIILDTPQVSIDREKTEYSLFENYFPTFLSHLFGRVLNSNDVTDTIISFAKVTVKNNSNVTAYDLRLEILLPGYSQSAAEVFDLGPQKTKVIEITPNFDMVALLSLNEERAGHIDLKLTNFQGLILDEWDKSINLLSKNDWVYSIEGKNLTTLIPVFVTPRNELVKEAVAAAKEYMFNKSLVGYQEGMMDSFSHEIDEGSTTRESITLSEGESITATITSITTSSPAKRLDNFYLENSDGVFIVGYIGDVYEGTTLTTGQLSAGTYNLVFDSSESWFSSRTVTCLRNLSHKEITIYQTKAIYNYLKAKNISYVNTPVSFFENSQSIKYPNETLTTKSGNCIDLTCLFASMLEALDMRPIVIIIPGHAFVGVYEWSNSNAFYAIETTMVGSDSFSNACHEGNRKFIEVFDSSTDKKIDVKICRDMGILPAPINNTE